jgi:ferric-dicitrate binding protein FerR (iron transport regulator)
MKTLAIRLEEEQHAQLGMIAQLEELTVTDAIRQAIEQWIEARRSNPQLQARAEAVLADIDRDAASRRDAIASLLRTPASAPAKRRGGTGGSKGPQAALGKEEPSNTGYL